MRLALGTWTLHEFDGDLPYAWDTLANCLIGDLGYICKGLQCIDLDLLVIDPDRVEETFHDEVTLLLVLEVLTCRGYGPLEGFYSYPGELDLLPIDVADGRVEDLADLTEG